MASNSPVTSDIASFGLRQLQKKIVRLQTTCDPSHWDPQTVPAISLVDSKLFELKNEYTYWRQQLLLSCSLLPDKEKIWEDNEGVLNECEDLLDKVQFSVFSARDSLASKRSESLENSTSVKGQVLESDFKLEKVKPPTFSGQYSEWQSYSDLFKAVVIDNPKLSGGLKLVYLKNSLIGDAANIAASFPPTNLSFSEAWELVEKRYNRKREIVFAHLQKLFSLTSVPDTSVGIRKLIDTVNQCIRSLRLLEVAVDKWDVFIVYWAHLKIDPETKKQWLLNTTDDLPVLSEFLDFLEKRAIALSIPSTSKQKPEKAAHHVQTNGKDKFLCAKCEGKHKIFKCPTFLELSPHDRFTFVKQSKVCVNCLGTHAVKNCKSESVCFKCKKRHHTLLHFDQDLNTHGTVQGQGQSTSLTGHTESVSPSGSTTSDQVSSHFSTSLSPPQTVVLMATLVVNVRASDGNFHPARVFVDPGSEANFVSESLVQRLSLPRQRSCVKITGIGDSSGDTARGMTTFTAFSRHGHFDMEVKALILPKLTGHLPREPCKGQFPHLSGLLLADPNFHSPSAIDILLGAESSSRILLPGLRKGPPGTPTAQNSKFGWFVTGCSTLSPDHTATFSVSVCHSTCSKDEECLENSLQRFWNLEEPDHSATYTSDEELCEDHFRRTFTCDGEGRYEVQLPFSSTGILGESMKKAVSCFKSLERQLQCDPTLSHAYHSQIQEYIKNDWIEQIPASEINRSTVKVLSVNNTELSLSPYYLPHHIRVKLDNSTTKFRIVYNASSKTNSGQSLNCLLNCGPKIQTDLHPLSTRFRCHPIALAADIVKFFHQVKVFPPHSDFLRFLWRPQLEKPFVHLRFKRVTFGLTSAPFLTIRVLRQLGEEYEGDFPMAAQAVKNDFLVDNLLSGATTVQEALDLKLQVTQLLAKACFPLQKWASNCSEVLTTISPQEGETFSMDIQSDESIKTIGLYWHPISDTFGVNVSAPSPKISTKREILSHVARVFDPFQWLSPVTISAKILLQSLWKEKVGWDDPIPPHLLKQWIQYSSNLESLSQFRIPRCLTFSTPEDFLQSCYELIGFCDASNLAYCACVYLRSISDSDVKVQLIAAKTRVAPIGGLTTPRVELCSAVLLAKLVNTISNALVPTKIKISKVLCFMDSTGALGQLFSKEKQPVFVLNRVRKIKNSETLIHWFHVPGWLNPADLGSRGVSVSNFLQSEIWLNGPQFLKTDEIPPQPYTDTLVTFSTFTDERSTYFHHCIVDLINSQSSFLKMKRLLAYWIRLQNNLRQNSMPTSGPLTVKELDKSQLSLVKCIQASCFQSELEYCSKKLPSKGQLRFLSPFLDKDGILRVGGRLQMSALTFSVQHPILLPKCYKRPKTVEEKISSHFVLCVARYFHLANLHAGPKLLLSLLRTEFWIRRDQDLCNRVFRSCVTCFKHNPTPAIQIMGQLPKSRVTPDFPFIKVGLDYAEPFEIAATPGRKPKLIKAYVCVFVCMTTKAVHLEFSGGLSTPDFLSAFQRFCALRNSPSDIFCDGGRNFLGAKNDMDDLQKLLSNPAHREKVALFFSGEKINFHFSPPYGPHHGGIWEAAVKSMKYHMARLIQGHHVSIEEFVTFLARTSAALNSRPLTPISNCPDDFEVLTPFHFLTLRGPKFIAEKDVTTMKCHRNRWQLVQQLFQHMFKRWSSDFLQTLQQKQKWLDAKPNIKEGMMVLLQDVDSSFNHQRWTLGRIATIFPGKDGRVRKCDVRIPATVPDPKDKTKTIVVIKTYHRPITRIAPLPIDDEVRSAYATIEN